jgi:C-terminal processing protease CtpA/Prc
MVWTDDRIFAEHSPSTVAGSVITPYRSQGLHDRLIDRFVVRASARTFRGAALPYLARSVDGQVVFADVPVGTKAWEAGVRRGDTLLGVDTARLAASAGAPPRLKPWLVGRRALSGIVGEPMELPIRQEDGSTITVVDVPGQAEWPDPIEWRQLPSGSGYLRMRRWLPEDNSALDEAFDGLAGSTRLIVDLRGNPGGTLVAATALRRTQRHPRRSTHTPRRRHDRPRRPNLVRLSRR